MLFVSINFSLEKDSVVFSAFVNYNIMLCIEFVIWEKFFSIAL